MYRSRQSWSMHAYRAYHGLSLPTKALTARAVFLSELGQTDRHTNTQSQTQLIALLAPRQSNNWSLPAVSVRPRAYRFFRCRLQNQPTPGFISPVSPTLDIRLLILLAERSGRLTRVIIFRHRLSPSITPTHVFTPDSKLLICFTNPFHHRTAFAA